MDDIITNEQEDPVPQMRGVGKEIWAGTDADEYVRGLRSNWFVVEGPEGSTCTSPSGQD